MRKALFLLFLLIPFVAHAQVRQGIRRVDSLPATCVASGGATADSGVLYQGDLYICTATNTWTKAVTQTTFLPNAAGTVDLGSTSRWFQDIYFGHSGSFYAKQIVTPTANRTITFPDADITVAGSASALTSTRIPYATTGGLLTDSANLVYTATGLYVNGSIAAGGTAISANVLFNVVSGTSDPAATQSGGIFARNITLTGNNAQIVQGVAGTVTHLNGAFNLTAPIMGVFGTAQMQTAGTMTYGVGVQGLAYNVSTGTISNAFAFRAGIQNLNASGTITNAYSFYANDSASYGFNSGTITNQYGLYVANPANSGTLTNNYGIYIASQTSGGTLNYALYSAGGTNYFAGNIQSGGTTQASLGTPANGTFIYCSDCTIANPCAGGGTGALAKRLNGVWVCN